MIECHVCFNLCTDDAELCPVCGAELRNDAQEAREVEPLSAETNDSATEIIKNPVLAVSADSPVTAEIFKDILKENRIAFSIDEKGDFLHTGFGGGFFAIDIYVDEKNLDFAKDLYRNLTENEFEFEDFDDLDSADGE